MKPRGRKRSLSGEAGFGLAASLVGGALAASLAWLVDPQTALRIAIGLVGGAYTLRSIESRARRTGQIVAITCWLLAAGAAWLAPLELPLYAASHACLAWLTRAAFVHTRPLPALLDLGFTAIAAAMGAWAASLTGSPFLGFWCFFLVQATQAAYDAAQAEAAGRRPARTDEDRFEAAYRAARAAIGALAARH